jgi:hypothetical protein
MNNNHSTPRQLFELATNAVGKPCRDTFIYHIDAMR